MKIICVGRNYLSHIQEFDNQSSTTPIFFFKPDSSILTRNRPFFLPDFSQDVQYEVELLVRICKVGKNINLKYAHSYYNEIGLGVDITARDLQRQAIQKGTPWEIAKSFDGSAVISQFVSKNNFANIHNLNFHLLINGNRVQQGNSADMIIGIEPFISYVSQFITLKIGDIIFTGTPAGVGKLFINDHLQGFIEEEKFLDFRIK